MKYLSIIKFKKDWNSEWKGCIKTFNTKQEASEYNFSILCDQTKKWVTCNTDVVELED
jgi:hypothetical protein